MGLFEVEVINRVVKRSFGRNSMKRIRGKQGEWYTESLYYLADSEEEAKGFAIKQIERRRIVGVSSLRSQKLRREIKVLEVRRLA
jgi:hypothetical protein